MFTVIATALGVATVAITLVSGSSTTAASGTAGGTPRHGMHDAATARCNVTSMLRSSLMSACAILK